jgi:hypothetical protein
MTVTTTAADAGSRSKGGDRGYDKFADGKDGRGRRCPTPVQQTYTIAIDGATGAQTASTTVTLEVESK